DFPEAPLALGIHGVDERLIAVAQVYAAPQRGTLDGLVRPGAVGELQGQAGPVLAVGHRLRRDRTRRHAGNNASFPSTFVKGTGVRARVLAGQAREERYGRRTSAAHRAAGRHAVDTADALQLLFARA